MVYICALFLRRGPRAFIKSLKHQPCWCLLNLLSRPFWVPESYIQLPTWHLHLKSPSISNSVSKAEIIFSLSLKACSPSSISYAQEMCCHPPDNPNQKAEHHLAPPSKPLFIAVHSSKCCPFHLLNISPKSFHCIFTSLTENLPQLSC